MGGKQRRSRTTLGRAATTCPDCGGGPVALIETRRPRRWTDLLRPGFDPDVRYAERCTACGARFAVTPAGAGTRIPTAAAPATIPLFASSADPPTAQPGEPDSTSAERPGPEHSSTVTPLHRVGGERFQAALFSDDDEVTERS